MNPRVEFHYTCDLCQRKVTLTPTLTAHGEVSATPRPTAWDRINGAWTCPPCIAKLERYKAKMRDTKPTRKEL